MNGIIKTLENYKLMTSIVIRNIIYICWYLYAIIMVTFIEGKITDNKLIWLFVTFSIVYFVRGIAKHYYRKIAHNAYHQEKHRIEMHYYKKMNKLSFQRLDEIDKPALADKILEFSYNVTRLACDIGEYLIPAFIGLLLVLLKIFSLNYIVGSVIFILIIGISYLRYLSVTKREVPKHNNYNDLLKDYVEKFKTIRKLNIFNYTYKELDNYKENDICIVKNNDDVEDIAFNNGIFIILSTILLSTFFIVDNTTTRLGIMIYFIVIVIKLQNLLFKVAPAIVNYKEVKRNKKILDEIFDNLEELEYIDNWKKINVLNGSVQYKSGVQINIPNFELKKGDQISILGKSGQGKSTILNALSGVSKLSEGNILFDDKAKDKVVDAIYLSKDTTLFKATLRDNICLGANVSDDVLVTMLKEIGLNNWFNGLMYGLDTVLDEREIKFTASQKQRINLLRAMTTNKEVIFLDEPSYELDIDTESKVFEMIKKYLKNKTIIIVTHKQLLTTVCKKHFFIQNHTLLEKEPLL